jgi:glycerophosphoryl diester phosphodiesterase
MKRYNYSLFLFLLLMSCQGPDQNKQPAEMDLTGIDIQGHRGCRGLMPENTWPAMQKAMDLGVNTLEMDVVITADSQVVLSHEPWMGHEIATAPDGKLISAEEEKQYNIYRMSFSELSRYDVGMRPHPRFPKQEKIAVSKPLLAAIFDSVSSYAQQHQMPIPFFNIETKISPEGDGIYHPAAAEFCELLMNVVKEKGMEKYVTIQSFDPRSLRYIHEHYPTVPTALLTEAPVAADVETRIKELGFAPAIYSPAHEAVTASMIDWCHKQHIRVIPWTVNSRERIDSLVKAGVDGVITDYPDLVRGER